MALLSSPNLGTDSPVVETSFVFLCFALPLSPMPNKIRVGRFLGPLSQLLISP